ncbi:MAG: TrkH family potassium uptake protein, partial [Kiritimatiellae bacterium]|nr:TrkH family potassium uptake protein [Kiritimatiellia bacterium]
MRWKSIAQVIGIVLGVMILFMSLCFVVAVIDREPASVLRAWWITLVMTMLAALGLSLFNRGPIQVSHRESLLIVVVGWTASSFFGSLPFYLSGAIPSEINALFETISGLTTTGASILPDPGTLPRSLLLWRSTTHFLGGLGIIVFCIAILPMLGTGGMQLFRAETSAAMGDRLAPRIAKTAKITWMIYCALTLILIGLLKLGGMNWFESVNHAFACISTGGFSTRGGSISEFHSHYIELVLILFMLIGAINFNTHYLILHRSYRALLQDTQIRFFLGTWLTLSLFAALSIWGTTYATLGESLRHATFSVTSMITTTGFCTEDFDHWTPFAKLTLFLCMLMGGCAGSTSGGIKQIRVMVVLKKVLRTLRLFMYPRAVVPVKVGRVPVEPGVTSAMTGFVL